MFLMGTYHVYCRLTRREAIFEASRMRLCAMRTRPVAASAAPGVAVLQIVSSRTSLNTSIGPWCNTVLVKYC